MYITITLALMLILLIVTYFLKDEKYTTLKIALPIVIMIILTGLIVVRHAQLIKAVEECQALIVELSSRTTTGY